MQTVDIIYCSSIILFLPSILLSSTSLTKFSFFFSLAQPWCMFLNVFIRHGHLQFLNSNALLMKISFFVFLDFYFSSNQKMIILDDLRVSTTVILFVIVPIFYFIYYRKFHYFIFDQKDKVTKGKTSRGKCPPFFPNGKKY